MFPPLASFCGLLRAVGSKEALAGFNPALLNSTDSSRCRLSTPAVPFFKHQARQAVPISIPSPFITTIIMLFITIITLTSSPPSGSSSPSFHSHFVNDITIIKSTSSISLNQHHPYHYITIKTVFISSSPPSST